MKSVSGITSSDYIQHQNRVWNIFNIQKTTKLHMKSEFGSWKSSNYTQRKNREF